MMVKMINAVTGSVMFVHESRLDEYIAAGHQLAVPPVKPSTAPIKRPPAKKKASEK